MAHLQHLMPDLIMYTLTLWDHYHHQIDTIISLPVLSVLLAGQRLSLGYPYHRHYCRNCDSSIFISGWISRFGVPSTVTTDRGSQFELALWQQLMQLLGCKCIRTMSYHPITNGLIERFQTLKASLKTHPNAIHWIQSLPLLLLGICTTIKCDLHCTTAELVYGTTLRLPSEFFVTSNFKTTPDPFTYLTQLKSIMQHITPAPLRPHLVTKTYTSDELL